MISLKKLLYKIIDNQKSLSESQNISKLYTATCSTAAGTAAKVATLHNNYGFMLIAGVQVAVTFTNGNSATTPTLNVNGTGAYAIAIPTGTSTYQSGAGTTYNAWAARETIIFTYTGTYWTHAASGYLSALTHAGLSSKADASAVSVIGTIESASNNAAVSITSETGTAMTSITLPAGTWVVVGKVRFSSNASGARRLNIATTSAATSIQVSGAPASGTTTDMQITRILTPTSATTYYLNAYQSSGSTLSCVAGQATLDAIRIK